MSRKGGGGGWFELSHEVLRDYSDTTMSVYMTSLYIHHTLSSDGWALAYSMWEVCKGVDVQSSISPYFSFLLHRLATLAQRCTPLVALVSWLWRGRDHDAMYTSQYICRGRHHGLWCLPPWPYGVCLHGLWCLPPYPMLSASMTYGVCLHGLWCLPPWPIVSASMALWCLPPWPMVSASISYVVCLYDL